MGKTTSTKGKSGVVVVTKPRAPLKHVDDGLYDIMYEYIDAAKVASFSDEQAKSATNLIRDYVYWAQTYIQFLAYEKDIGYYEHENASSNESNDGQETPTGKACFYGARDDVQNLVMKEVAPAYYYQFDVTEADRSLSSGEYEFLATVEKNVGNILFTLENFISIIYKNSSDSAKIEYGPTEIIHKTRDLKGLANHIRQ